VRITGYELELSKFLGHLHSDTHTKAESVQKSRIRQLIFAVRRSLTHSVSDLECADPLRIRCLIWSAPTRYAFGVSRIRGGAFSVV